VETETLRQRLAELEAEIRRIRDNQKTSEQRFLSLADSAPIMIWMAGADARGSYFNRAWLDYRGRTLAQELDLGWMEGVHPDDRSLCRDAYAKAFAARDPVRVQFRLQRADGDYGWMEGCGSPRFNDDGVFAGYLGCTAEVKSRRATGFKPDDDAVRTVFALTERERQVLALIAEGKSTKETAVALGISYKTADSHRSRILEKLGVHETASMVRCAIRAGLIDA
jgi:PAS domain S-box-containing protein